MLQVGYQRDDAGKARFVGSESVSISTRSVGSQTQSQIRMRNRVSLFLSSSSGNELVHPGCRGLKAKNSPYTRSQMPLETACADAASMLHWVCEAPASISIVITTQSIPTELLTPAQFIASGPWRNWHTQLPQEQPSCGFNSHWAYQNSVVL